MYLFCSLLVSSLYCKLVLLVFDLIYFLHLIKKKKKSFTRLTRIMHGLLGCIAIANFACFVAGLSSSLLGCPCLLDKIGFSVALVACRMQLVFSWIVRLHNSRESRVCMVHANQFFMAILSCWAPRFLFIANVSFHS